MAKAGTRVSPGWMIGAAGSSVVAVGPGSEIEIELAAAGARPADLVRALSAGDIAAAANGGGFAEDEAAELIAQLSDAGALAQTDPAGALRLPGGARPLAEAIAGPGATAGHELIITAEEAILLPPGIGADDRDAAIHAFVAGIQPFGRLRAYSRLLYGSGEVAGDLPDGSVLDAALTAAGVTGEPAAGGEHSVTGNEIIVIDFEPPHRRWRVAASGIDSLDARAAHRLGPVSRIVATESFAGEGLDSLFYTVAEIAEADLANPTPPIHRRTGGAGTEETSELTARAEGAERFAMAVFEPSDSVVASASELDGAIPPDAIFARNARQLDEAGSSLLSDSPRLWCRAFTFGGEPRWLPAEAVGGTATGGSAAATSSGLAAHTEIGAARDSALAELIERDAFMWTWIQQLSRERIAPAGAPDDAREWVAALARNGWRTDWVNLTLETLPVILCCLTHDRRGLVLGAACRPDAAAALRRATLEALVLALRFDPSTHARPSPRDVRAPVDHLLLHMDPAMREHNRFLHSSAEEIDIREVRGCGDVAEALTALDVEPLWVDISDPRTRPFKVVRVVAPGLIPLAFGWDSDPLGMPLAATSRRRANGSSAGRRLDLSRAAVAVPHPFA